MSQPAERQEEHFAPVEAWNAIAASYDEFVTPGEAALAAEALALAGVKPGEAFLDVAAGSGGLSVPAAQAGARVVATDWSPTMVARFNARVQSERLPQAEGRVMDCHSLTFPDDTFDVTGSLFGVMLVPRQATALREMVRVTKPGGRVLLIGYGSPRAYEALQLFIEALRAVNPSFEGLPADPPPLEFQIADPAVMARRLEDAGLRDVRVDTSHQEELFVSSGEELWDWCLGGNPIPGLLVSELTAGQRASMRERLHEAVRARAGGGARARLTAAVNIGVGTKPQPADGRA